jgi:hypothetical protein
MPVPPPVAMPPSLKRKFQRHIVLILVEDLEWGGDETYGSQLKQCNGESCSTMKPRIQIWRHLPLLPHGASSFCELEVSRSHSSHAIRGLENGSVRACWHHTTGCFPLQRANDCWPNRATLESGYALDLTNDFRSRPCGRVRHQMSCSAKLVLAHCCLTLAKSRNWWGGC